MTKILAPILMLMLLFQLVACNPTEQKQEEEIEEVVDQKFHEEHEKLANNFEHKDIIILDTVYTVNDTLSAKFKDVVNVYLQIADALVNDDLNKVDLLTLKMMEMVKAIPLNSFVGKENEAWKQHSELYEEELLEMSHIEGMENKRSYFSHISEIMYCTLKSFDFQIGTLYVDHCPMAFNGKGAYWLSDSKSINNPYFGKAMLNCGEIKEEIIHVKAE